MTISCAGRSISGAARKRRMPRRGRCLRKLLQLDPQYAGRTRGWVLTYLAEWSEQWSQDPQMLERAFDLAQRAVALDNFLPLAHGILG